MASALRYTDNCLNDTAMSLKCYSCLNDVGRSLQRYRCLLKQKLAFSLSVTGNINTCMHALMVSTNHIHATVYLIDELENRCEKTEMQKKTPFPINSAIVYLLL